MPCGKEGKIENQIVDKEDELKNVAALSSLPKEALESAELYPPVTPLWTDPAEKKGNDSVISILGGCILALVALAFYGLIISAIVFGTKLMYSQCRDDGNSGFECVLKVLGSLGD